MASTTLAAALGGPPSEKLTQANFLFWKGQVLPALRGAQVMGLLDGTDPAPNKTMEVEDSEKNKVTIPNPAYGVWISRDQQVVSYILRAVTQEVHADLLGLEHAAEIWAAIDAKFSAQTKARVGMLRTALTNTKKRDLTATVYINKMKGFASELAAAGRIVSDEELKEYLLAGLHGEYNGLVTTVNAIPTTTSADVCNQLLAYDYRQKMLAESEEPTSFSSSVNVARRGGGGGGYRQNSGGGYGGGHRGGGHGGGGSGRHQQGRPPRRDGHDAGRRPQNKGGRGRGHRIPSPHQDITCQICKKTWASRKRVLVALRG